jgi:F-type H+-transporting ATPase subunit a
VSGEKLHIDPISQFAIHPLFNFSLGGYNLAYTNSSLYMTLAVVIIALFFLLAGKCRDMIPTRLQAAAEMFYEGVANLVRENAGAEAMRYFPLIFALFFIVLLGNVLGMIPGSFTFTSHIIVTLALAMALFIFITVLGFAKHGLHFFSRFLPPGVPTVMAPFIIALEVLSYLVRPFTLAVRLFANMMAGHLVLKVFAYFAVGLITSGSLGLMLFGLVPVFMNVALIALELFVAVLQALIFTILTCVYLRDALVIEH